MQRVEVQSQRKKHAVPIACKKIRQNRSETLIAVPGSTVTYSRLNRKYNNLCIYPRNPSIWRLIFCNIIKYCSSFWMDHKSESICAIIDRFWSIYDVRRYRRVDFSLNLESGAFCSALHTPNFFIWIFQSERGYIYAFYRPNFKLKI